MKIPGKLRIDELVEKLGGRSRASIYNDVAEGRLPPPFRYGKFAFWDEKEVDEHIERMFAEQRAQWEAAQ